MACTEARELHARIEVGILFVGYNSHVVATGRWARVVAGHKLDRGDTSLGRAQGAPKHEASVLLIPVRRFLWHV